MDVFGSDKEVFPSESERPLINAFLTGVAVKGKGKSEVSWR